MCTKRSLLKIVNTVAGIIYLTKRQPLTTMITKMVREGWDPPSKNLRFHSQNIKEFIEKWILCNK